MIHIGSDKAGSTAIQWALHRKREYLAEKYDLYYPLFGIQGIHHAGIANRLGFMTKGIERSGIDALRRSLNETSTKSVVMSSEHFFYPTSDESIFSLREASQDFDVKIIMVLRNQHAYLGSRYREHIKWGLGTLSEVEYAYNYLSQFEYHKTIENWRRHFASVITINYDLWCNNIVEIFSDIIGISKGVLPNEIRNKGPSDIILYHQREINREYSFLDPVVLRKHFHALMNIFAETEEDVSGLLFFQFDVPDRIIDIWRNSNEILIKMMPEMAGIAYSLEKAIAAERSVAVSISDPRCVPVLKRMSEFSAEWIASNAEKYDNNS